MVHEQATENRGKMNYYNEFNPEAAAWLRELIKQKHIADGEVDERSIIDVQASDIRGFTQCHFFAGIGGWSYALRLAGWTDDKPVCTASLPCQPFSVAGAQKGIDDERHLLPHFIELVKQCNFQTIFGEQVPGAIKHGWLDDICTEMEREKYRVGQIVLTAAGEGAPHIRQRLYWVANRLPDPASTRLEGRKRQGIQGRGAGFAVSGSGLGNTKHDGHNANQIGRGLSESEIESGMLKFEGSDTEWSDPYWIYCRDKKYRPIESSIKPLVNGIPKGVVRGGNISEEFDANNTQEARAMRLKGYGNAIVPQVASSFIQAFMAAQ